MKTVKIKVSFLILFRLLLLSMATLSQSQRALIAEYRKARETILQNAPVTMDNRMAFYQSMDRLPRIVWGKVAQKVLSKKEFFLYGKPYLLAFYDYDAGFDFNFDVI